MKVSKKVICFGLGVTDPKGVFGTTLGLEKKFGKIEYLMYLHQKML
jgi:pyruvate/2-oxoglutarate/acetoin dehydrogenase E1 component